MDYEESLMIKAAWYYYFEEMTQQHVAELMGIKPAVVSATLISTAVVNGVPECLTAIVVTTAVVLAVKKIKFPRKGAA